MSETATLAGGCFWCLEAVFDRLRGVESVVSGYMGGEVEHPDYHQVCSGNTGHAEVVQIHFDPEQITFETLLDVFFAIHDPTTLNRQGNDIGTQYRSVIYYHTMHQQAVAQRKIESLATQWPSPIVTRLEAATTFWAAENYHQNYFDQNPAQPYCAFAIAPKLDKARLAFESLLKKR